MHKPTMWKLESAFLSRLSDSMKRKFIDKSLAAWAADSLGMLFIKEIMDFSFTQ